MDDVNIKIDDQDEDDEIELFKNVFYQNYYNHNMHMSVSSPANLFTSHTNNQTFNHNSLSTLILNSCYIDLKIVELLINKLNNLNELHLSSNNYSNITFSNDFTKMTLKILYFNNNQLNDWNEVCKLGKCFPNLENLVISHNNLSNFNNNENNELCTSNCFRNLQILIINRLKINEWSVIDQLREFPHLKHVRIQNIPLLNNYNDEEKYYMLVAHLNESIDSLNGSKITNDDKENCERKYIRHFMDLASKPKRYYELESKHGKLNKLADVNLDIRNKRVQCKIKFGDKHVYEKIDVRQTVGEFKKQLEKFVGVPSSRFKVFYIDIEAFSKLVYGPEELKHPNRSLFSFNIRDGDEFEIDLKPLQSQQQQQQQQQQLPVITSTDYQFCPQHLHHLHVHHYTSHFNNNSLHQLPFFNLGTNTNTNNNNNNNNNSSRPLLMRNRKVSDSNTISSSSNSSDCSSSRTFKRTKPGMVSPPSAKPVKSNLNSSSRFQNKNNQCSLPANLSGLKTNKDNSKQSTSLSNNQHGSSSSSSTKTSQKPTTTVVFTAGDPNDEN